MNLHEYQSKQLLARFDVAVPRGTPASTPEDARQAALDLAGVGWMVKALDAKINLDDKVRAVLVNIFGGIVRCDLIAEGIVQAVREVGIRVPVVVRLEGTNAEQGLNFLENIGLDLETAHSLEQAADQVVAAAGGVA